VLTGDASLRRRPMQRVIEPLSRMGARFEGREGGRLPLTIIGTDEMVPIEYRLPVASAQVKSAILLAGLNTAGETTVIEPEATRDHTERMLRAFGADVRVQERNGKTRITVAGDAELQGRDFAVPADPSSAAFLAAAAALVRGSDIVIEGVLVNPTRVGFYGISAGADAGTILTALEPRLKASVLQGTGIWGDETPENNAVDYAPRIRVPTLMLNGRYDFSAPPDTAQRPLFDLLGTPPGGKRHVILDTGHAIAIDDAAREMLPWFDRYLGPVALTPGS